MRILILMLISINALAVEINDTVDHYEVEGSKPAQVIKHLEGLGDEKLREDAWGLLEWTISTSYHNSKTADRCSAVRIRVELDLTTTLPQWKDVEKRPINYQTWWQSLYRYVEAHEAQHKSHALDAAKSMETALKLIPPQPNCSKLRSVFLSERMKHVRKINFDDHVLDAQANLDQVIKRIVRSGRKL